MRNNVGEGIMEIIKTKKENIADYSSEGVN
jgi:hypothetical protein